VQVELMPAFRLACSRTFKSDYEKVLRHCFDCLPRLLLFAAPWSLHLLFELSRPSY